MLKEIDLSGQWEMHDEDIAVGPEAAGRLMTAADGWIAQPVPGDVHQGLQATGRFPDPLIGLGSFQCDWIEGRSFWLRRKFNISPEVMAAHTVEIHMDGLDVKASIFLNGVHVADHPSALRPLAINVRPQLREGENVLLVRLTHGLEKYTTEAALALGGLIPTEALRNRNERGDIRRVFVRKPQYVWGWDFTPRLATVGIGGAVVLRVLDKAAIADVQVTAAKAGRSVRLTVATTVNWTDPWAWGDAMLKLTVAGPDGELVVQHNFAGMMQSGDNRVEQTVTIASPRLWWPAGYGPQDRYTISLELLADKAPADRKTLAYGIRFVELDTTETFALRVNGVKIYCRGANWVPSDILWARVTDERVDALVREARACNFNMLRVWGGGHYERDAFYEACDREGILVWQDFMFACAPYNDADEAFCDEIRKEAAAAVGRLRNRACMALWCGGNECLGAMTGKWGGRMTELGCKIFGRILPQAVAALSPHVPYWNNTPYGGPDLWNSPEGDNHYWVWTMNLDVSQRVEPLLYDRCESKFVSEFGYVGPCSRATTEAYLGGEPMDRRGRAWVHHDNTFDGPTVEAGIAKNYKDAAALSDDEYFLYGGLYYGVLVGYALESMRGRAACNGSLFWMFNEPWGEVGWAIQDYYLRRKIGWWFIKRAFAPRRVVLRANGGKIVVTLANDTREAFAGALEYGYVSLDGKRSQVKQKAFNARAASRTVLATFARGASDERQGVWFARVLGEPAIAPGILRACDHRQLATTPAALQCIVAAAAGDEYEVSVQTDVFAHGVELALPGGAVCDDNYFDLLPGERRIIRVNSARALDSNNVRVTCVAANVGG